MIDLKEALAILESGDWCSMRYISANVEKGSGGKVISFSKCRIARKRQSIPSIKTPSTYPDAGGVGKDPRHHLHFTRNVELYNKEIRKVHPILITHINNKAVI